MNHSREVRWLNSELPKLTETGIINEETAARIRDHYFNQDEKPAYNIALIITSILGALLIGGGITLIFAYNWEDLSRSSRTILSFAPLITAQLFFGFAYFFRKDSLAWKESTSGFLMLMMGTSIALIDQTYSLGGRMQDFVLTWMLLTIPLIYLANSTLVSILYMMGIAWWTSLTGSFFYYGEDIYYWVLIIAVIPHLLINTDPKNITIRSNILGWTFAISLVLAANWIIPVKYAPYRYLLKGCIYAALYLVGKYYYAKGSTMWARPFQTVGIAGVAISSMILSYKWHFMFEDISDWFRESDYEGTAHVINIALVSIFSTLYLGMIIFHKIKKNHFNYFVPLYPWLVLAGIYLYNIDHSRLTVILFNLFIFAYGIYYLVNGFKQRTIALVNAGMAFISALILIRFFDSHVSFLVKGTAFIIVGVGFLVANIILLKKMKKHAA